MIVSITVATTELDACGDGAPVEWTSPGAGAPVECASPAKAVPESAQASAIAITKRFIFGFSFGIEDARLLVTKTE
jgi:hypothetical protein